MIVGRRNHEVFWRIFKADDTAYVVWLYEIGLNQTGSWRDDSSPTSKPCAGERSVVQIHR
jgi:hypothetical protein